MTPYEIAERAYLDARPRKAAESFVHYAIATLDVMPVVIREDFFESLVTSDFDIIERFMREFNVGLVKYKSWAEGCTAPDYWILHQWSPDGPQPIGNYYEGEWTVPDPERKIGERG